MPFMTRIPSDLARFGLTVELAAGWATRGSSSFAPAAVTCHWTAGPKNAAGKARPSLAVVTNGRAGLEGPLCNIYLARDGTCVVVAAGRANHAGLGGFRGLVGNSAVYGIEAECGGDGDWTKAQRKVYPRLVAALLSGLGRDASWSHGHNEWAPTRKIDIRDIMPSVRAEAAAILANPNASPGDTVSMEDVVKSWYDPRFREDRNFAQVIHNIENQATAAAAAATEAAASAKAAAGSKVGSPVAVDAGAVAAALAKDASFLAGLAKAVNDDAARRLAS